MISTGPYIGKMWSWLTLIPELKIIPGLILEKISRSALNLGQREIAIDLDLIIVILILHFLLSDVTASQILL